MRVNGEWVTGVAYEANVYGPDLDSLRLRFLKGNDLIAEITRSQQAASELLGDANLARIRRAIATDADKYLPRVTGTLRGEALEFRDILLPSNDRKEENSLEEKAPRQSADGPGKNAGEESGKDSPSQEAARGDVPPHIASKYVRLGGHYHFDDETLAFIDRGTRLTAKTENKAVIQDLVAIAKDRGWPGLRVRGTESFRQEVWREAAAAGLTVLGYSPTAADIAARDRSRRADPSGQEPPADSPGPPAAPKAHIDPSTRVVYGTLIALGAAPFRHDTTKPLSFHVTLRDKQGHERTFWGAGLKDALRDARTRPQVGDEVGLRRTGTHPVAVTATTADANGEIRSARAERLRALWIIEKSQFFRRPDESRETATSERPTNNQGKPTTMDAIASPTQRVGLTREQEAAAAIRSAQITREELQLKYPDLNKAVFQHFAAQEQFAAAYVKAGLIRESDRQQVIAQMRERLASKVERGEVLREPNDTRVNALIRRSVNRVAADIGRPPVEIKPRSLDPVVQAPVREEAQVRM